MSLDFVCSGKQKICHSQSLVSLLGKPIRLDEVC